MPRFVIKKPFQPKFRKEKKDDLEINLKSEVYSKLMKMIKKGKKK